MKLRIDKKIGFWKTKLLDLGKKNKLIHSPLPKSAKRISRTSLIIEKPDSKEVWNILYKKEHSIQFAVNIKPDTNNSSEEPKTEGTLFPNGYKTNQPVSEACKTLLTLKNKARVYMENKGMNALYMAFGFLNWQENGAEGDELRSPLVLLPVTISQDSIISPVVITKTDDDPLGNNALQQRLKKDFDIEIPDFDAEENLNTYLKKIQNICSSHHLGWNVEMNTVQIMMVSYLKMAVYNDMEKHEKEISTNPVVKALNGSSGAVNYKNIPKSGSIDHDSADPKTVYSVVDADSSQQDAIELAKSGTSFVLQGPPGTGKSQTITNIIAELLGQGKKVLFVSEKMAALEVVYKRLSTAGLGDFCLTLHDPDAKRKDIIDQLAVSVKLAGSKVDASKKARENLDLLMITRSKLDTYVKELHTEIKPLGETIFHINGYLSELDDYPDIDYAPADPEKITSRQFNEKLNIIKEFAAIIKISGYQKNNPWNGCNPNKVTHQFRQKFLADAEELSDLMYFGLEIIEEISSLIIYGEPVIDIKLGKDIEKIIDICLEIPEAPFKWIKLNCNSQAASIDNLASKVVLKNESLFHKSQFEAAAESLIDVISGLKKAVLDDDQEKFNIEKNDFSNKYKVMSALLDGNILKQCNDAKSDIDSDVGVYTHTRNSIKEAESYLETLQQNEIVLNEKKRIATEQADAAENTKLEAQKLITNYFSIKILDIDRFEIEKRFECDYKAAWEFLCENYSANRSSDLNLCKVSDSCPITFINPDIKMEYERLMHLMKQQTSQLDILKDHSEAADSSVTLTYKEAILGLDITDMMKRFSSDYRSIFRAFNSQYRKDCLIIKEYSKTNEKASYKSIIELLELIDDAQHKRKLYIEQKELVENTSTQIERCLGQGLLDMLSDADEKNNTFKKLKAIEEDAAEKYYNCQKEINNTNIKIKALKKKSPEDSSAILKHLKTLTSIINIFKSNYKKSTDKLIDEVNTLCKKMSTCLSIQITENSNFDEIKSELLSVAKLNDAIKGLNVFPEFLESVMNREEGLILLLREKVQQLKEWNNESEQALDAFTGLFNTETKQSILKKPIITIYRHIKQCRENMDMLESYVDYKNVCAAIVKNGLGDFLSAVIKDEPTADDIVPIYQKSFYHSWLDAVIQNKNEISSFRHDKFENTIKEFRRLDVSSLQISQDMLKASLIKRLPNLDFSGNGDEAAILKREMAKKSRFMPIRKLIASIPMLLPSLKPCMLMSPLSVSTYFGSSDYIFDTVIFDEASQIRTEESICSIMRAKQTIIAGDSKQLPPTDFFSTSISDSDEYTDNEMEDLGAYESLLDEASILPTQTLLWHYRSKHEHLISFSNEKIYKNTLITFPSSISRKKDLGVEYVHVQDGVYDRGGKSGNVREAQRIAELLLEHFKEHPERSIGVIAFGERQQNTIENEIIRLRQAHTELEKYFKDNIDEPFFVRNLESVQGDERDTIIFSIGYGFDSNGKFNMNFGPLSREGGERRLNVAITRARYNIKLVGSILPLDIKLDRISAMGPQLLKEYIEFAIKGSAAMNTKTKGSEAAIYDHTFEKTVYDFLVSQGYNVSYHLGCSDYKLDMAVTDPEDTGRFILGIECDGEMYRSARTARERDRLRNTVLEKMGWNIYHVWSTDWIKDPINEKKRLLNAVKNAADMKMTKTVSTDNPVKTVSFLKISQKTEVEKEYDLYKKFRSDYYGREPAEIPSTDYITILTKILKDGYGSRLRDNLIRDAGRLGYGWSRLGPIRKKYFNAALTQMEKRHIIEIVDDEVKLIKK